jgi:hypothetical protein
LAGSPRRLLDNSIIFGLRKTEKKTDFNNEHPFVSQYDEDAVGKKV